MACFMLTFVFFYHFDRILRVTCRVALISLKLTLSFALTCVFYLVYKLRNVGVAAVVGELKRLSMQYGPVLRQHAEL